MKKYFAIFSFLLAAGLVQAQSGFRWGIGTEVGATADYCPACNVKTIGLLYGAGLWGEKSLGQRWAVGAELAYLKYQFSRRNETSLYNFNSTLPRAAVYANYYLGSAEGKSRFFVSFAPDVYFISGIQRRQELFATGQVIETELRGGLDVLLLMPKLGAGLDVLAWPGYKLRFRQYLGLNVRADWGNKSPAAVASFSVGLMRN